MFVYSLAVASYVRQRDRQFYDFFNISSHVTTDKLLHFDSRECVETKAYSLTIATVTRRNITRQTTRRGVVK